jgi:hypothetical protein
VNDLAQLLSTVVAPRAQEALRPYLSGPFGGIVRSYLPQTWWFQSPEATATLIVASSGALTVHEGLQGEPDVTIGWTLEAFLAVLGTGDRRRLPQGSPDPKVTTPTAKGRTAFEQLRRRLGL